LDTTHSKDCRDIKFVEFGPVDIFLWNLQDQGKICDLNLNFKTRFHSFDWGTVWTGHMAAFHWRIPIREAGYNRTDGF
jgi:hypothetical protein